MPKLSHCAATALALGLSAAAAHAAPIADYQDDFNPVTPQNGWSYLWNAAGPSGAEANYRPLVSDGATYRPNPADPNAAANTALQAGSAPVDPAYFPQNPPPDLTGQGLTLPPLPSTYVRPGQGTAQDGSGVAREVVIGFTFDAADIAAHGNQVQITDYYFAVSSNSTDGMTATLFLNGQTIPFPPFPPGFAFQTAQDPDPIPLGPVSAGDTLYVALGPGATGTNDEMRIDFELSLVPEPGVTTALAGFAGAALLRRRRRA